MESQPQNPEFRNNPANFTHDKGAKALVRFAGSFKLSMVTCVADHDECQLLETTGFFENDRWSSLFSL